MLSNRSLRRRALTRARALAALRPVTLPPPPAVTAPATVDWQSEPGNRVDAATHANHAHLEGHADHAHHAGEARAAADCSPEPGNRVGGATRRGRAVTDVDARIAGLAQTQHALVSTAQARALGLTQSSLDRRVRAGRLEFVAPGVVRVCGAPVTWEQHVLAACLSCGPHALAARSSAAFLWRLDGVPRPSQVEILVPIEARVRSRTWRVATTDSLLGVDRSRIDGVPCTAIDRTICDLAAVLSEDTLELVVEDALRRELTTVERLRWRNEMLSGRRGTARLRRLLDSRQPGRASESAWEVRLLQLLRRSGLPAPVRQFDVFGDDGALLGRVDLAYPERRLGIEFDSNRWHSGRAKVDAQSARRNRFTAARWRLLHVTSTSMSEPDAVIDLVRAEYERDV